MAAGFDAYLEKPLERPVAGGPGRRADQPTTADHPRRRRRAAERPGCSRRCSCCAATPSSRRPRRGGPRASGGRRPRAARRGDAGHRRLRGLPRLRADVRTSFLPWSWSWRAASGKREAIEACADDFIAKPFDQELLARVAAAAHQALPLRSPRLSPQGCDLRWRATRPRWRATAPTSPWWPASCATSRPSQSLVEPRS